MSREFAIIMILLLTVSGNSFMPTTTKAANDTVSDVDVLVFITTAFGWNYFDIVEQLEEWDVNVVTVSCNTNLDVSGCFNQDPVTVTADILISDIDNDTLDEYDCIFIPSGGQWQALKTSPVVIHKLEIAYERGLVIASICVGTAVIAGAYIINGTKVCAHSNADLYVRVADGIRVLGMNAVSHNGIVTGGTGSGPPTGFEGAPTYETCAEVVRETMGLSRVSNVTLVYPEDASGREFTVEVEVDSLNETLPDLDLQPIESVTAVLYQVGNATPFETKDLNDSDADGIYTGSFSVAIDGEYEMDVEVTTENDVLEVVDSALLINIEPTSQPIDILTLSIVSIASIAIVVIIIVLVKKNAN